MSGMRPQTAKIFQTQPLQTSPLKELITNQEARFLTDLMPLVYQKQAISPVSKKQLKKTVLANQNGTNQLLLQDAKTLLQKTRSPLISPTKF